MTIYYLSPSSSGLADGSDWDNANTIANLASVYAGCQPGDEIWLSSVGTHVKTGTTTMANANSPTEASPIRIRGMRPYGTTDGYPEKATITGNRTTPWPVPYPGGATAGGVLFNFTTGAYTRLENLIAISHDIMVRATTTSNVGLHIVDCEAINVRAGFSSGVTISALRIRRFNIVGFTLYGVYVAGDSSDILVEDCDAYQMGFDDNDTGSAPRGFMLDVSAHNVRFRRCRAFGGFDYNAGYWNGDGFSSEEDCYDVVYEDCYASDWPDGGWDTKASGNILRRCVSERNSRNYRTSYQRVGSYAGNAHVFEDCVSRFPVYRGGSGSGAHLSMSDGVAATPNRIEWTSKMGSLIEDYGPTTEVVLQNGSNTEATFTDAIIRKHVDAPLGEGTGTVTFIGCAIEGEVDRWL